jgi:hypothetical protein
MLESYNDKSIKGYVEEYLPVPNETGPQTNATWRDTLDATCTSLCRIDPCYVFVRSVFQIQNHILRFFGQPERTPYAVSMTSSKSRP